jgi:hypothetical protein
VTESYISPNGTHVTIERDLVHDGFRLERQVSKGGVLNADRESVWLRTLDGKRTVGCWFRFEDGRTSGLVCHYRDRGDDSLRDVTLDELVAYARERWPRR